MDFDTREIRRMEIKDHKIKPRRNSSSRALTVVIILLLLANIAVGGYIAYDKGVIDEFIQIFATKPKKQKVEEKTISLSSEEVSTLYSYIEPLHEKFAMSFQTLGDNLTQEEMKAFGLSLLKEEDFEKTTDGYKIKKIVLEDAIHQILGKEIEIEDADMTTPYYQNYGNGLEGMVTLQYDEVNSSYLAVFTEKEETMKTFDSKLVKAVKKGNQLILTEKAIYPLETNDLVQIYSNWRLSNLLDEVEQEELDDISVDSYMEDASSIVYTFEKVGDNYQFISSETIEKN